MKVAFILAAVLTVTASSPNGFYHQEYNYKTSSQSFRNNELQHKTDDQGYYKKDGDLEGRVKPKVSSNSEHSEYINPKLQYGSGASAGYYDADSDTASQGNMLANIHGSNYGASGGYHSTGYGSEGLASSDYIGGAMTSGSQSVNLRNIASRLQSDLGVELQSALVRPSYQTNIAELEAELHRNLTSRLNEILQERYGSQTIRSGQSYSISGGRVQAAPNYEQSDLDLIQRQVENTLLQELRQQYNRNSQSSHSQQSIHEQSNYDRYVSTTTYRPTYSPAYDRYAVTTTYRPTSYRPIYPNVNQVDTQDKYPSYPGGTKNSYYSQSNTNSRVTYSQAPHAISITNIASTVQNNLNNQLNRILEQAQTRYFNENSGYTAYNTAPILDNLKQELRQNLTYTLDEELRRQFGTQYQRDGYMFTSGTGGETNQYNYNVADLENLKRQVEENLITKLNRDFEAARQHWVTRQQSSSHSSQQTYYGHGQSQTNEHLGYGTSGNIRYSTPRYPEDDVPRYSTPRYPVDEDGPRYPAVDDYHRPTAASIVPLISSGIKNNHYQAVAGSHLSGYETSGAAGVGVDSSSNFARLQQQMQADLSRQLQAALTQTTASYRTSGHTSTSGGRAAFDQAYNQLFDELQRNLTQQLQSYQSGSSSSGYSSSYSGINESQLAQLRSQLQNSLASQLQQGLQQSFSASASYSASSSGSGSYGSSGYRPVRGSDLYQYGQYKSGGNSYAGEDCQGDDPLTLTHQYHRVRRSYGGYRSRPLGLSTYSGSGYNAGGTYGGHYQTGSTLGQEVDDSDTLVQSNQHLGQEIDDSEQVFDAGALTYGRQTGQKVEDSDDTQQVEVDNGFTSINLGSNLQAGQSSGYSHHFEVGSQKPKNYGTQLGQEEDDSETLIGGHQKLSSGYSHHFEVGSQKPKNYGTQLGQEEDDSDTLLGGYHKPSGFSHVSHFEMGSQKPTTSFGSQTGHGQHVSEGTHFHYGSNSGRYPSESYYTTQSNQKPVYQFGFQKPAYTSSQSHVYGTHQVDDSDDTQQVEDADFGQSHVQVPSTTTKYSFGLDGAHYVQTNQKPTPKNKYETQLGQEVDDSEYTQQELGSSNVAVQPVLDSKPIVNNTNRKPLYSETLLGVSGYQPKHKYGSQLGQEEDTDDTQKVEVDHGFGFNNQHQQNEFDTFHQVSQSTTPKQFAGGNLLGQVGQEVDNSDIPSSNNLHHSIQYGQEVDDTDTMQVPVSWDIFTKTTTNKPLVLQYGTTTKNPSVLQYGTPNVLPESETVNPLQLPTPKNPIYTYHFSRSTTTSTPNILPENENLEPLGGGGFETPKTTSTSRYYYSTSTKSPLDETQNEFGKSDLSTPYQRPSTQVYPEYPKVGSPQQTDSVTDIYSPQFTPQNFIPPPRPGSQYMGVQSPQPHSHYDFPKQQLRPTYGGFSIPSASEYPGMPSIPLDVSFSSPPVEVPIKLKEVTAELQTEFLKEIENIVNNDLPSSNTPKQLYQETLQTLQENITIQCQKLLTDARYTNLHIYREDVVILEKYLQYQLTRKLNEKFTTYLRYPIDSQLTYGRNYGQKPQTSSFLDSEIQHNNQYYPSPSIHIPQNTPKTTTALPVPMLQPQQPSVFQPIKDNDNLNAAEREADLLIQRLRNSIQRRKNSSVVNQYDSTTVVRQPQDKIIKVKLENLTNKQVQIIDNGLENLYEFVNEAVQNQYEKTKTLSVGKNVLYQRSLESLEKNVKIFLADCIEGNNIDSLKNYNLDKYSNLIASEFNAAKIPDLQKYLEIKLIKKLRAQLKTVYNIQTEENVEFISQPQQPTSDDQSVHQPQYKIIKVKLENLTSKQVEIIENGLEDLYEFINVAVQNQYEKTKTVSVSKNVLYERSLESLEKDVKIFLADCIEGNNIDRLKNYNLDKYSNLIASEFDAAKIPDLQKYLEIKLNKKLRAQLKTVYNIQTEEENVEFISQPQQPTSDVQRVVVKLDKLTPTQYKIITDIEEEIGQQIEASIQMQIDSLKQSQVSSFYYQQVMNDLKIELLQNITETIQKLCEPGFGQYSQLVSANFDKSKISDLEKYLEIKLSNKLTESIAYHSSEQSSISSSGSHHISYSSSSTHHHYGGGYSFGHKHDGEPLKREEHSYQSGTPQLGSASNKAVKGGSQYIEPDAEVVPEVSSAAPVDTEATTPKQGWWQNFSSKVKTSANKLKDKIVGNNNA